MSVPRESALDWVGLVARLILGAVLLIAGALKVVDLESSVLATRAYQILPYQVAVLVGYLLPMLEVVFGLLLITGLLTRIGGAVGALFMLAFAIAIASVWVRGISIDCGCFGGGGNIDPNEAIAKYPLEIARDLGLMALGVYLAVRPHSRFSLDRRLFGGPDDSAYAEDAYADDSDDDVTNDKTRPAPDTERSR